MLQFKQIVNTTIMVGQFTSPLSLIQQNIDPQQLICPLKSTDLGSYLVIENEIDYNNKWCTFEVVDQNTFIVQCIYMGLLLIFSIVFIYLFCKMIKLRKNSANSAFFSAQFIQTYILISCWLLSTYVRVSICIAVYLKFISPAQVQDPSKQHTIAFWSAIYNFFNFFCAFIVDLLILIIPTHWINNILANIKESRLMSMNDRKKIDWFNITQKITRFYYLYIRNLVACVVFCEIFIFLYSKYSGRCQMPFYSYSFTVVETLFFLAYYFYAAYVVHFLQKINVITVRSEDLELIIWEYRFLLIAIFTRLILDIYSAYLQSPNNSSKGYNPNRNCYDQKVIDAQFFISLSLHHVLMHLLPIIVVLFIYRPVVNNRPPSQIIVYVDINDNLLTQQPNASFSTTNGLQQNMLQSVRRSGASSIFTMNQQNKERK